MRFTRIWPLAICVALAACSSSVPLSPMPPMQGMPTESNAPVRPGAVAAAPQSATAQAAAPALAPSRNWTEYRLRAAQRIHAAATAAGETFGGTLPDPLESIPVLQVHLNRDGSVAKIDVLRVPRQSPQTVQMAMRAVQRAAPFESPAHLPHPWMFPETFLYNESLRFQLRTLAEAN